MLQLFAPLCKVTWINEAHLRGYKFDVLCHLFVAHIYHPGRKDREGSSQTEKVVSWYEHEYWPSRYHFQTKRKSHFSLDEVDEYAQYKNSKQRHQKCRIQYESGNTTRSITDECFQLSCIFVESAILWSLLGGQQDGLLDSDEQLAILVEAEECAAQFFAPQQQHGEMKCDGEGESYPFRDLIADLYMNMGVVEKKRHGYTQAAAFLAKSVDFGSEDAQHALSKLPGGAMIDKKDTKGHLPEPGDFMSNAIDVNHRIPDGLSGSAGQQSSDCAEVCLNAITEGKGLNGKLDALLQTMIDKSLETDRPSIQQGRNDAKYATTKGMDDAAAVIEALHQLDTTSNSEQLPCIARPKDIQDKVDARKTPLILYYNEMYGRTLEQWFVKGDAESCYECASTSNQSLAMEADVVVFHYFYAQRHPMPPKYCDQYWVMVSRENPNNLMKVAKISLDEMYRRMQQFDISATYRLDDDIPIPYMAENGVEHVREMFLEPTPMIPTAERIKDFPVAWIASNCAAQNDRMERVRELMKYIGVKSYGKCLNNAHMDVPRKGSQWNRAATEQVRKHKFYLAFENSDCSYYSTEKLERAFLTGLIPVVLGSPQASLFVPNNHSAIYVREYPNMKAVADRLHAINNDDALFESYLSYRGNRSGIDVSFQKRWFEPKYPRACRLCDMLRRKQYSTQFVGVPLEHLYCNNTRDPR